MSNEVVQEFAVRNRCNTAYFYKKSCVKSLFFFSFLYIDHQSLRKWLFKLCLPCYNEPADTSRIYISAYHGNEVSLRSAPVGHQPTPHKRGKKGVKLIKVTKEANRCTFLLSFIGTADHWPVRFETVTRGQGCYCPRLVTSELRWAVRSPLHRGGTTFNPTAKGKDLTQWRLTSQPSASSSLDRVPSLWEGCGDEGGKSSTVPSCENTAELCLGSLFNGEKHNSFSVMFQFMLPVEIIQPSTNKALQYVEQLSMEKSSSL